MASLRPKEGGSYPTPGPRNKLPLWIPVLLIVLIVAIGAIAYGQYAAKSSLEQRIAAVGRPGFRQMSKSSEYGQHSPCFRSRRRHQTRWRDR